MPIRPENRGRYPKDWKAISAAIRLRALWAAAFHWPPSNLEAFAEAAHANLPALLDIAEAYYAAEDFVIPAHGVVEARLFPEELLCQTVRLVRVVVLPLAGEVGDD